MEEDKDVNLSLRNPNSPVFSNKENAQIWVELRERCDDGLAIAPHLDLL